MFRPSYVVTLGLRVCKSCHAGVPWACQVYGAALLSSAARWLVWYQDMNVVHWEFTDELSTSHYAPYDCREVWLLIDKVTLEGQHHMNREPTSSVLYYLIHDKSWIIFLLRVKWTIKEAFQRYLHHLSGFPYAAVDCTLGGRSCISNVWSSPAVQVPYPVRRACKGRMEGTCECGENS